MTDLLHVAPEVAEALRAKRAVVAHAAGIRLFATGGIGGVHRGAPLDVSADLLELGRTPVAVVCAGAKAILDLPLTIEVLESHGVPIVGLGTDTLPAFYSRSSGLPIDVNVATPAEVAEIIAAAQRIGAKHGILVTVPVPAADELPANHAHSADLFLVATSVSEWTGSTP